MTNSRTKRLSDPARGAVLSSGMWTLAAENLFPASLNTAPLFLTSRVTAVAVYSGETDFLSLTCCLAHPQVLDALSITVGWAVCGHSVPVLQKLASKFTATTADGKPICDDESPFLPGGVLLLSGDAEHKPRQI